MKTLIYNTKYSLRAFQDLENIKQLLAKERPMCNFIVMRKNEEVNLYCEGYLSKEDEHYLFVFLMGALGGVLLERKTRN